MRAEPAQRACADPTKARRERAFEGVWVIGPAKRFEIADEQPHHLVSSPGTGSAHLVGKSERAQGFLEWTAQRCCASKHDGEITVPQLGRLGVKPLDLPRAEESLVDSIAFARHHHSRKPRLDDRTQPPCVAARLGGS